MTSPNPLRVVQWDTGNIGTRSLKHVIQHPGMTLVGVYVHSPDKAGRDAGDLCGLEPTGVLATREIDDILKLAPDCVLYMSRATDIDEICQLLSGGSNVVTTLGDFHRAQSMDPAVRERVEAACAEGGTSVHSTGSSPGFITEAVPIALTSIQRRLDHLKIQEFADVSQRDSPEMLFDLMGFGHPPADFDDRRVAHVASNFGPSLELLADALGLPLDSVESSGEVATVTKDTTIAAGVVKAGTIAAQRINVIGIRDGKPLLQFQANWYCVGTNLEPAWDLRETGWHISVAGDAALEVAITFPISMDEMAQYSPGLTANRAVNAVIPVCAAAPGVRSTLDLPNVRAILS
jgi:hypothetical protein